MAIDAAKLRVIIEALGVKEAGQQIQKLGSQLDSAGKQSQGAVKGLAALDKHALNAKQRAERLGAQLAAQAKAADQAAKGMDKTAAATAKASKASSEATAKQGALASAFSASNAKALLATAGIAGLGITAANLAKSAVTAGIAWEDAWAGVEKTVDGSRAELQDLSDDIRDMARNIPMAATDLAGLAEAAGQLGVSTENIAEFTRVAALLGTTTDISANDAAMALGQLQNILGLTSADFERFGSALVEVGNNGASTESAILGITTRMGAAAKLIGFSTDETLGWAAAVANLGIETQAAGGAIQTFAVNSAKIVAEGGEKLQVMAKTAGMTAEAFKKAYAESSSDALQTFIEGLGKMTQAQQLATLAALGFTEINIGRTVLGLANSNDNLANSLGSTAKGWQDNTAMAVEAEKRFKTTSSQMQIAKNRLNDVAISIGDAFLPAVADAAEGLGDLALGAKAVADHLTSTNTLNAMERWESWMEAVGAEGTPFPEAPEETGRRWGHFISDWLGHDWDGVWDAFKAPDDIMNDWADFDPTSMNAQQLADARAELQGIIDAYGDLRPEMGGVTEAQRNQAQELLRMVDAYQGVNEHMIELGRQGLLETEVLQHNTDAWREQQQAAYDAAESWFRNAEAQSVTTQQTREQAEAQEYQLAVMADLESGMGAYMGQLSQLERMQHDASLANWMLAETFSDLANAYQQNLADMDSFGKQASEYDKGLKAIEDAYDRVQEKVEKGIELSAEEQLIWDNGQEAMDRYTGGIEDAETQQALYAIAAAKVMKAQDELNAAIERNEDDLGPYNQRLQDAKAFMEDVESATGHTGGAQKTLADIIETNLIGAIDNLTRKVEYISKPWLMEIDAATDAAEREIERIKGIIAAGAYMPISIGAAPYTGTIEAYASGGSVDSTGLALVGEKGPELVVLPGGSEVIPNHKLPYLGGYADGTPGAGQMVPGPSMLAPTFNWDWLFGGMEAAAAHYGEAALEQIKAFVDAAKGAIGLLSDAMSFHDSARGFQGFADPAVVAGLVDNSQQITRMVGEAGSEFSGEFLDGAKAYSDGAKAGISLLSDAAALMATLSSQTINLEKGMAGASALKFLTEHITLSIGDTAEYIAANRREGFVAQADLFAQSALSGVELMSAGAGLMGALAEMPTKYGLDDARSAASDLKFLIEHIVLSIGDTAKYVSEERSDGFVANAATFSGSAQSAVALIADGLSFVSALADFEGEFDLAGSQQWASDLKFLVEHIALSIGDSAAYLRANRPEDFLSGMEQFAGAVAPAIGLLVDTVGLIETASAMKTKLTDTELRALFDRLVSLAHDAASRAADTARTWNDEVNPNLEAFAGDVGNSVGIIKDISGILSLANINPDAMPATYDQVFEYLTGLARMAAEAAMAASETWDDEADPALEAFVADAGGSLGLMSQAGDALGAILAFGDVENRGNLRKLSDEMLGNVKYIVGNISEMAEYYGTDGLESTAAFSDAAKESLGLISAGTNAFEAIVEQSVVSKGATALFKKNFEIVLEMVRDLNLISQDYLADALSFEATMKAIAGAVSSAAGAINTVTGVNASNTKSSDKGSSTSVSIVAPPPARGMATGGVVTSPLTALIGEAGPEMVQPLSSGHPERQRLIDDVATAVVQQLGGGGGNPDVAVFIDGDMIARKTAGRFMQGRYTRRGP